MKVILKEYVYMQGVAGDIIDVADGYARNYLLPQGKAVKATPAAIARNEMLLAESAIRRQELNDQLLSVANKIEGVELVFGRKAGRNNKLYGSVTTSEIADALREKTGIDINRRRISDRSLRELGTFDVPVRMGHELAPVLKVVILPEEDVDAYLNPKTVEEVSETVAEVVETVEAAADETLVSSATEVFEAASEEVSE